MKRINMYLLNERLILENREEWLSIIDKIPNIQFDNDWLVKVIPPYNGAIVRFIISKVDKLNNTNKVSIYLDTFSRLGTFYRMSKVEEIVPYWELYNFNTNQTYRFELEDTNELLNCIRECLNESI